ncbi:MAG TPA: hypothetical protein VG939_21040 [Caulobacteraceae bacterium]|nr:hypothetical protein [Caulobacteraceae bacterium]
MKQAILGAVVALLPGLALADPAPAAAQPATIVDDQRPPIERTSKLLSVWMWSCSYGVLRVGDQGPFDRSEALGHDLDQAFGARLAGHRLVLRHYTMYVNGRAAETAASWGAGLTYGVGGAVGAASGAEVAGSGRAHKSSCPASKMEGGSFDASELTTPFSPYIAEIELDVDGQPVKARAVYSPPRNVSDGSITSGVLLSGDEWNWEQAAVAKADAALVEALGKVLPPAPPAAAATPPPTP